jgi:hypothetical protein
MPTKAAIEARIARLRQLPQTPARQRELKALERCLGLEIRSAGAHKNSAARKSGAARSVRKRTSPLAREERQEQQQESKQQPGKPFNASAYLQEILGNRHRGMS